MDALHRIIIFVIVVVCSFTSAMAQSKPGPMADTLFLDNSIRHGRLPNGFTYYMKSLTKDQPKLYLNFYVKAGYNQEDKGQLNLAHALEHLAFKATEHFPEGLSNVLGIGLYRFNGSTGSKGTNYNFDVPINNVAVLDTAFLWFKDIATGLTLSDTDIDHIREELRQEFLLKNGKDLNKRFAEANLQAALFPGRKSRDHFFEHLKAFKPETLRRFYKDWYRPDLMALSVIGNIKDLDAMERKIKETFSDIRPHKNPRIHVDFDSIYFERPSQYVVVEKPTGATSSMHNGDVEIQLFFRAPDVAEKMHTLDGIKSLIRLQLLIALVSERLNVATHAYNSFYAGAFDPYTYGDFPPTLGIKINAEHYETRTALQQTIQVLHQLQKYGALEQEWTTIKKERLQSINNTDSAYAKYWVNEIGNHFLHGQALPSHKHVLLKNWLSDLSLGDFNDFVREFLSKTPEDIGIIAPTGDKALSYGEQEIRSRIKNAFKKPVHPYMLPETPTVLMPVEKTVGLKEKGYIDKGIGESGARELVLDNGIQVVLKSYKPSPGVYSDKIMLHGFSPKGASCASKEDYYAALLAPGIVKNAGVGAMNKFMLKRFLSNTSISVSPYIGYYETGITANAALNDVGKMLQLIYLYITTPRKDQEAFEDWKLEEQKSYYNSSSNIIQADFYNAIGEMTGDSSVRRNPLSSKRALQGTKRFRGIEQANLDKAYEAYKSLFGHAKDFTFLISGAFAMDSVLPLVQKYLGNLPDISDSPQCSQKPANTDAPSNGLSYHEIPPPDYQMHNTSYSLRFMSKASDMDDWREEIKVRALGRIAMLKAWSLRFEKGYSLYDLSASGQLNKDKSRYEISINFNCELKELPLLRGDSKKIIHQIKSGQVTREILQKTFKELKSAYNQTNATTPREMQHRLYNHYRYELSWVDSVEAENYIESLTLKDIMDAANVYCKEENLFEFVMKN